MVFMPVNLFDRLSIECTTRKLWLQLIESESFLNLNAQYSLNLNAQSFQGFLLYS